MDSTKKLLGRGDVGTYAYLFYGETGAGKSWMAASALVDPFTGAFKRKGAILDSEGRLFHLNVPKSEVVDIRPPFGHPEEMVGLAEKWIAEYLKGLHYETVKGDDGKPRRVSQPGELEVIGIDGLSEEQFLLRRGMAKRASEESSKEDADVLSQRGWGKLGDALLYMVGYLYPTYTHAHLVATAYAEVEHGLVDEGEHKIHPALGGMAGTLIAKYFDFVIYVKKRMTKKGDGQREVHRYYFRSIGDFLTKNVLEHTGVFPDYLDSTVDDPVTFDTILELVAKGEKRGN